MKIIKAYLTVFRAKNLAIIALTMYLMRWGILKPFAEVHQLESQITELNFFLLVLSVVFVAAGGYLINDYFDLKIDRINKPEKIVVGRFIKRRVAIVLNWVLNAIGFFIGFYVSYTIGLWQLCFIHLFLIFSLWFYSTEFKRQLIIGNFIISMAVALVPFTVALYEIPALEFYYAPKIIKIAQDYAEVDQKIKIEIGETLMELDEDPRVAYAKFRRNLFYWILAFSGFAFLLSFSREITKDAADIEGDETFRCKTIPIVFGTKNTKIIVSIIYLLVIGLLITAQQMFLKDKWTFLYVIVLLVPMLIFAMISTIRANNQLGFQRASSINKLASVIGILYAVLAHYLISGLA